jgi:hypothetical protein
VLEQEHASLFKQADCIHSARAWQFTSQQARAKLKKLYPVVKIQLD